MTEPDELMEAVRNYVELQETWFDSDDPFDGEAARKAYEKLKRLAYPVQNEKPEPIPGG